MKKFIYKSSLFLLLILTTLLLVNYFGDSARLFTKGYEEKIINIISNNKNATNISNFDWRLLRRVYTDRLNVRPDVLVLGSSRVMLINNSYFDDKKLLNNAVTGAALQDLIAIFQMYKTKKILPKSIIIGLDPWIFNVNNEQKRWLTLSKEYYSYYNIEKINNEISNFYKIKELISPSYFQESYKNLLNKSDPISTKKTYNKTNTLLFDGSLTYGEKYRKVSQEIVDNKAVNFIEDGLYSLEKFDLISADLFDEFERFCNEIVNNKIKLSIILIPYHPIVYNKINNNYKIVLDVENKIIEFAKNNNIKYFGSYNPENTGISRQEFYDGMHLNESGIKIILNQSTKP